MANKLSNKKEQQGEKLGNSIFYDDLLLDKGLVQPKVKDDKRSINKKVTLNEFDTIFGKISEQFVKLITHHGNSDESEMYYANYEMHEKIHDFLDNFMQVHGYYYKNLPDVIDKASHKIVSNVKKRLLETVQTGFSAPKTEEKKKMDSFVGATVEIFKAIFTKLQSVFIYKSAKGENKLTEKDIKTISKNINEKSLSFWKSSFTKMGEYISINKGPVSHLDAYIYTITPNFIGSLQKFTNEYASVIEARLMQPKTSVDTKMETRGRDNINDHNKTESLSTKEMKDSVKASDREASRPNFAPDLGFKHEKTQRDPSLNEMKKSGLVEKTTDKQEAKRSYFTNVSISGLKIGLGREK